MKKIFWFSRHEMTQEQLQDLQRIYGQDVVVDKFSFTANSAREIVEKAIEYDVLAVVLPPNILADLVNPRTNEKPVIRAKANRVPTGGTIINPATKKEEQEFRFEHAGWEKIVKIEIITEAL